MTCLTMIDEPLLLHELTTFFPSLIVEYVKVVKIVVAQKLCPYTLSFKIGTWWENGMWHSNTLHITKDLIYTGLSLEAQVHILTKPLGPLPYCGWWIKDWNVAWDWIWATWLQTKWQKFLADLNQGIVQFLLTIHVDNNNKFVHVSTATMLTNQRTN